MEDNSTVEDINIADISFSNPTTAPADATDAPSSTADTQQDSADTQTAPHDTTTDGSTEANSTEASVDPDAADSQASDELTTDDNGSEGKAEQTRQAAQNAWKTRQRSRQQIAEQLDQTYGPKSEDQLVEEGLDQTQASIEALRQEYAYKEERARVSELNANMRAEALEVFNDFPVFNPQSPDFDADFARDAEATYKQAARLQTIELGQDANGQPIEVVSNADVSLYDHYQRMYNIYNRGTSRGAVKGQQQAQQMMSRTENPGGSSSANGPASGSLEEMEARLGDIVIA